MAMKDIAQIADAMREEKKPATLRGYASQWKKFREWCEAEGWEPLPADPYVVARFLIHRYEDDGLAAGSVAQAVQAIAHYHRDLAESPTEHRVVKKTMAGLRRRAQRDGKATPKQARGLTAEDLRRIRETASRPRPWGPGMESEETARRRGSLEMAVIATMRDALLRRGEASALEWRDVMFLEDGTGRVTIRTSKTSWPSSRPGAGSLRRCPRCTPATSGPTGGPWPCSRRTDAPRGPFT